MRSISAEIGKVGYSVEFYFMAMVTLNMIIKQGNRSDATPIPNIKTSLAKIMSGQILTDDIQAIVK